MSHTTEPMFEYKFNQLPRYENGRTPVLLTEAQYKRASACVRACKRIGTDILEAVAACGGISHQPIETISDLQKQVEGLQLAETNLRQQVAHLTDQLAGEKSNVELANRQLDERQAVVAALQADQARKIAELRIGDEVLIRVTKQRDDLLAALESSEKSFEWIKLHVGVASPEVLEAYARGAATESRAAIASVKGGA